MKEKITGLGEVIYKKGDIDERFFFLDKGKLEFFMKKENASQDIFLGEIHSNMFFGHVGFFSGKIRDYGVRSTQMSNIIYLNKDDFINVMK